MIGVAIATSSPKLFKYDMCSKFNWAGSAKWSSREQSDLHEARGRCEDQSMSSVHSPQLAQVLHDAREAVSGQMSAFEESGLNWQEESITSQLLTNCYPSVRFATFTRTEEAATGSDWLWWWIDDEGEAFGMLVQAKRLHHPWRIDFNYDGGRQRHNLFETAEALNVPPMYTLYLGTAAFREGVFCRVKPPRVCDYCDAAAVSIVPALLTDAGGGSQRDSMSFAIQNSSPLEWLPDSTKPVFTWDANFDLLDEDLKSWIVTPQHGARGIARRVFDRVVRVRAGSLSHGQAELATARGTREIFPTLPLDFGHFAEPYHHHILRGLRTEAPDYVLDIVNGFAVETPPHSGLAGIAVVRC